MLGGLKGKSVTLLFPFKRRMSNNKQPKQVMDMIQVLQKEEMKETAQDARHALGQERDHLGEMIEKVNGFLRILETAKKLQAEYDNMKREAEVLRVQLQEAKEQRVKAEMQLNEMTKLSASVAAKASHDAVEKALRVFVNKSKRKKVEKRSVVKEIVLEMANANGIVLPEDLATTIDSLDDEQGEGAPLTINGDYVVNKTVDNEVNGVATGGTGINVN